MANDLVTLAPNLPFLDDLYERFRADPNAVDSSWRALFENGVPSTYASVTAVGSAAAVAPGAVAEYAGIYGLVNAYRVRGHLEAKLDPLDHLPREPHPDLDPRSWGFAVSDGARVLPAGGLYGMGDAAPLDDILHRLRATYCQSIGLEMMHIAAPERREWLQKRIEPVLNQPPLDRATKVFMLEQLAAAELFEDFVHKKYVGTKRFSLEGGETTIPMLHLIFEHGGKEGLEEVVIGMAHRGRLSVLTNIIGKSVGDVFAEFEDIDPETMFGGGDVKYHLGYSSDQTTRFGHKLHLTLAFNPSHLEAVDPVVVGRVRAKLRRRKDHQHNKVLGIILHGDAAFAGQGLVAETLNLSNLRGYRTGGTVHIVINNQIGFTTAPASSRSGPYCTDIAKMIQVPIFHVNGDDPEAVAQVVNVAMDYRKEFRSDVVIDMFCYRKYGHNETDEPSFTQPLLYQRIERHPPVRQVYTKRLVADGVITEADAQAIVEKRLGLLNAEFERKRASRPKVAALGGHWQGYEGGPDPGGEELATGVSRARIAEVTTALTSLPEGFRANPKVARLLQQRAQMGRGEQAMDWGMGEHLAFATLLWDGHVVRMTGQDVRRGTFSQRHALVVDQRTEAEWIPLQHLREGQGTLSIFDSPLSEAAVLGFEFGYSLDFPDALVIWEAQFGDFVNGAQVIIDQFITSSEDKWQRLSGLVLLLPHGFEGQGPEHSSARYERFLESCAEDNIQVCYPTTPAQYFHLLRRQALRTWHKPLVVMTPKSLLRLPAARSTVEDLEKGRFRRILYDQTPPERGQCKRVLLCTGKIFYDLEEERKKRGDKQTAIVRIEQLYPLSDQELTSALDRYAPAQEIVWVQEEPMNMGAQRYIYVRLLKVAGARQVRSVTRAESASPATGSHKAHMMEQGDLMRRAFAPLEKG